MTTSAPSPSDSDGGASERDRQLVERIRSGDGEAFEAVFHAYAARLCRTAYRYVKSWDVAEDLVQEVFLKIWRGRAAWRVTAGVESYLLLAVRNQALNWLKHDRVTERWRQRAVLASAGSGEEREHPDACDAVARAEDAAAIERALAALPARQRAVCELRWQQHLSYGEIAARLGISERTVENQIGKAIRRIRAAIGAR
jgi:RNA polymerase sigma-70 factor (ECF subfamily)